MRRATCRFASFPVLLIHYAEIQEAIWIHEFISEIAPLWRKFEQLRIQTWHNGTNRVADFNQAILSRIHVMLRYGDLTKDAGKKVWELFIEKASTSQGPANISVAELKILVNCKLNGRQVSTSMPYPPFPRLILSSRSRMLWPQRVL